MELQDRTRALLRAQLLSENHQNQEESIVKDEFVKPEPNSNENTATNALSNRADDVSGSEPSMKKIKVDSASGESGPSAHASLPSQFEQLLSGMIFCISGLVNPERATIRSQAVAMGAVFRKDWSDECTVLICAFKNTPKYRQVVGMMDE